MRDEKAFRSLVAAMRYHQRRYERLGLPANRDEAKRLADLVDDDTAEYLATEHLRDREPLFSGE